MMFFAHIVDDYYLQGLLAKLKQKSWWEENAPDKLYKHDYIMALIMHAFSWSFMINLPALMVNHSYIAMCIFIIANTIIHAITDNQKANKHSINLIQDQFIHIYQILWTWVMLVIIPW